MLLLLLRIKVVKMELYNLHVTNEGRSRKSEGECEVTELQASPESTPPPSPPLRY